MDGTEARNKISQVESILSISEYTDKIDALSASKEAFSNAETYLQSLDWENARAEYVKVIPDDSNYNTAAEKIKECDTALSEAAYQRGQVYEAEGKWIEALAEYEKVTDTSSSSYGEVPERKRICIDSLRTSTSQQLDALFAAEKYEEGLALIAQTEKYIPDDESLKAYKENFELKKQEVDQIREQQKYDTGITYDQLARYLDEYKGKYIKFYGKVLQVQEASGLVVYRIGTAGSYYSDNVIYAMGYNVDTSGRILEDDFITVKGKSMGLYTYESVLGASITIPSMQIEKIEK